MDGRFFSGQQFYEKIFYKKILTIGLLISLVGGTSLLLLPMQTPFGWFFLIASILGIGFGLTITTTTVNAQSVVEPDKVGVATSFNTLVRTIGQTVMVSIFGVILNANMYAKLADSKLKVNADVMNQLVNPHTANSIPATLLKPLRGILFSGLHNVFLVGSGLVVLALILNLLVKDRHRKA